MRVSQCPTCNAKYDLSRHQPGKKVRCGRCKAIFTVPPPEPPTTQTQIAPEPPAAQTKTAPEQCPSASSSSPITKDKLRRPSLAKSRLRRFARHEDATSDKKPTVKIAIAAAVIVAVAGLAFFLSFSDKPRDTEAETRNRLKSEFVTRELATDRSNPDALFQLYEWCSQYPDLFARDAEELLRRVLSLAPEHAKGTAALRLLYSQKSAEAERQNTEAAWIALAEFCQKFGLKSECEDAANRAVQLNKNSVRGNELLGRILVRNEYGEMVWESKEVVAERETIYRLGPREKFINSLSERTYGEVFHRVPLWEWRKKTRYREAECKEGWILRDYEPYVIFLEKAPHVQETMFDEVYTVLERLAKKFFKVYYGEEKPATMVEELMAVFIFKDRKSFMERTGAKHYVGAYFSSEKQALMVPYDTDRKDRETLLYHEGAHQLVDFVAKKGGGGPRPFWFEEGIATNFEAMTFGSGEDNTDPLTRIGSPHYLLGIKVAISTNQYKPFKEMIEMSYADGQRSDAERGRNYAQSWAMVYFLYNYDNGKYRARWKEYFIAQTTGKGGLEAFENLFGDATALEREWVAYIQSLSP